MQPLHGCGTQAELNARAVRVRHSCTHASSSHQRCSHISNTEHVPGQWQQGQRISVR
jgi:hypothetical protein